MQGNFEKVKRAILDPMMSFFGVTVTNEEVARAYVEDLGNYDEETLRKAFAMVRRSCRTKPMLAHFVTACEELRPKSTTSISNPQNRNEYVNHRDTALADQVMKSEIGQYALRKGVGQNFWMQAWRDGKSKFTKEDVERAVGNWREAVDTVVRSKDPVLAQFFESIQAKECDLEDKYLKTISAAWKRVAG